MFEEESNRFDNIINTDDELTQNEGLILSSAGGEETNPKTNNSDSSENIIYAAQSTTENEGQKPPPVPSSPPLSLSGSDVPSGAVVILDTNFLPKPESSPSDSLKMVPPIPKNPPPVENNNNNNNNNQVVKKEEGSVVQSDQQTQDQQRLEAQKRQEQLQRQKELEEQKFLEQQKKEALEKMEKENKQQQFATYQQPSVSGGGSFQAPVSPPSIFEEHFPQPNLGSPSYIPSQLSPYTPNSYPSFSSNSPQNNVQQSPRSLPRPASVGSRPLNKIILETYLDREILEKPVVADDRIRPTHWSDNVAVTLITEEQKAKLFPNDTHYYFEVTYTGSSQAQQEARNALINNVKSKKSATKWEFQLIAPTITTSGRVFLRHPALKPVTVYDSNILRGKIAKALLAIFTFRENEYRNIDIEVQIEPDNQYLIHLPVVIDEYGFAAIKKALPEFVINANNYFYRLTPRENFIQNELAQRFSINSPVETKGKGKTDEIKPFGSYNDDDNDISLENSSTHNEIVLRGQNAATSSWSDFSIIPGMFKKAEQPGVINKMDVVKQIIIVNRGALNIPATDGSGVAVGDQDIFTGNEKQIKGLKKKVAELANGKEGKAEYSYLYPLSFRLALKDERKEVLKQLAEYYNFKLVTVEGKKPYYAFCDLAPFSECPSVAQGAGLEQFINNNFEI